MTVTTHITHSPTSCNLTGCQICRPLYVNGSNGTTWTFTPTGSSLSLPYDLVTLAAEKFLPLRSVEAQRALAEFLEEAADLIQNSR